VYDYGEGGLFRVTSGDRDAVVDGIEGFGEDSGDEADEVGDGVGFVFFGCGDGFVVFDEDGGVVGGEEELRPCGDGVFPEGSESG
jgi:hypothetical protein